MWDHLNVGCNWYTQLDRIVPTPPQNKKKKLIPLGEPYNRKIFMQPIQELTILNTLYINIQST